MFNIKLTPLLLFCLLIFILLISVLFRNNFPLAESFSSGGGDDMGGDDMGGDDMGGDDTGGGGMGGGDVTGDTGGETIVTMKNGDTISKVGDKIVRIPKTNTSGDMILNEDSPEDSLEDSLEDSTKEATFNFDGMREPVIKASDRIEGNSREVKFKKYPEAPSFFVPADALEQ